MARKDVEECCKGAIDADRLDDAFRAAGAKRVQAAARVALRDDLRRRAADVATRSVQVAKRRKASAVDVRDVREATRARRTARRATTARR